MTYEKPVIRDLGDIAKDTDFIGGDDEGDDGFPAAGRPLPTRTGVGVPKEYRHPGPGHRAHERSRQPMKTRHGCRVVFLVE